MHTGHRPQQSCISFTRSLSYSYGTSWSGREDHAVGSFFPTQFWIYAFRSEIVYWAPLRVEYNRTIQRRSSFFFMAGVYGRFKKYPDHVFAKKWGKIKNQPWDLWGPELTRRLPNRISICFCRIEFNLHLIGQKMNHQARILRIITKNQI